ncbi:hypothetical protein WJX72_010626 [[Myrmecia] bisecta]|uniref:AAA+ ATPase domain-containing protein n=1 Tax=[Myrmecia] bisecta TaxID=41462 RepID=A0AAW1Q4I9_9CHLO
MSNVTYDIMWREAMMELLDQLEAENPEDPSLAPKDLSEWSCIYIKYLQIFRKLDTAYDQVVHPQKRIDMKKALEACMGRVLELRHWLVKLNKGLDFVNLDDILVDLKLTPEVLEVPAPRYFIEDRSKELKDRAKFLDALTEKYTVPDASPSGGLPELPALSEDDAILLIQCNERGRQARERSRIMRSVKRQRQLEDKRTRAGMALNVDEAAMKIQACMRGSWWRSKVRQNADEEQVFIGMKPKAPMGKDPQVLERKTWQRRKGVQHEHQHEYEDAVVSLRGKVKELEGQDMREDIQDKINAWFINNRNPETGEYPDFPEEEEGGSKIILNPPPPPPEPTPEELAAAAAKQKGSKGKGKAEPPKKGKDAKKTEPEAAPKTEEVVTSVFVSDIEEAVKEYVDKWQERDESANFAQRYDAELVKAAMRPLVFEEVRVQVDEEMRILLQNLKDMVAAERAAKTGKKVKAKKAKKAKKKGKEGKGKKKKDPTVDRTIESLYAELVSTSILQKCPEIHIQDYLGAFNFLGATLEKAHVPTDPSIAQIRHVVTEYCLLSLGSAYVHEKAPIIRSVLLYGAPRTGKTSLAQAVAHLAGANFLNISPRHTDGKFPGKTVAMMIHMVFKVAKMMAPSVIYINEIEKVFVSDKKKMKEFGGTEPFSRIKKELLKEVKALEPSDRVLIMCSSSEPHICVKKDEKAFISFFDKHIYLPLPDYASRRAIWAGLIERHGGKLPYEFDLSTLAHISDGYSSGTIDQVVRSMLTPRRLTRLSEQPLTIAEVLQWLCRAEPTPPDPIDTLRAWADKTPARAALLQSEADKSGAAAQPKDAKKGGKGKKAK